MGKVFSTIKVNSKQDIRIICVVPLYNPQKEEIENIDSYVKWLDYCILMDDSIENQKSICEELLEKHNGKIEYIWNGENIGLCKSANNGIKRAIELGAQWVLIMNPDSNMHNNIVSVYRDYICAHNIDNIAILAPQYNYDRHKRSVKPGTRRIKHPNMSGSLINVTILDAIGLYDERCYIDGLDNEWCLRAYKAGYRVVECSEAIINHHPADTREFKVFGICLFRYGFDNPTRYYYQFRSFIMIHKMYHDFYNDMFCVYKLIKSLILFKNKRDYWNAWKKANIDFKKGYFGKMENNEIVH